MEFTKEQNGLYRLLIDHSDDTEKREVVYWFDEMQGFAPVRNAFRIYNPYKEPPDWETIESSEGTWEQVAGSWVPKTFSFVWGHPGPDERRVEYHYAFEWESVNEELNPALFSKEAFDEAAVPGTPKFDRRLSEPVLVKHVNQPPRIEKKPVPIDKPDPPPAWRSRFLAANGIVIAAVAVTLLVWWLRRAS